MSDEMPTGPPDRGQIRDLTKQLVVVIVDLLMDVEPDLLTFVDDAAPLCVQARHVRELAKLTDEMLPGLLAQARRMHKEEKG